MSRHLNRRQFLKTTAAGMLGSRVSAAPDSSGEKLKIAQIGVAGRGAGNLKDISGQEIVALCDVDANRLVKAAEGFPEAKKYTDFRKMLVEMEDRIEAVLVATPDHIHAPAGVMAMKMGKHCYCEKPLAHNVAEARLMAELAAEKNLATQMGTQIHATNNYRRVVEMVKSGCVGPIGEVHVWCRKNWGGGERPTETPEVPENLDWDLWLGPAPDRPYHPTYAPALWRRWWDFGNGTLGDMACHYMDLPFWALDLRHPTTVEAEGPPVHPETCPTSLTVRYEFPARGEMPPVKFAWYDGTHRPALLAEAGIPDRGAGVLFVGSEGILLADYGQRTLYPAEKFADYEPPEKTIPDSIGHHAEWIEACKTGSPTTCNFNYSGALSESVLLGTVAYRTGTKLEWDAEALKATNCPEADKYIRREYRKGWEL